MLKQLNTSIKANFRETVVEEEAILQLIPQRKPMLMIDCFYGIEENNSYAGLLVQADNIFCQNGKLQEAGVLEHIAQSAAARIGYIYTKKGKPIPLGYIGSIDRLTIHSLPNINEELITQISLVQEVGDITLIAAQVSSNDHLIAEGRMKIFLNKK